MEALNAALGTREGPFLFNGWRCWQDNISVAASLCEEDVLHDEEIQLFESSGNMVGVGVGRDHVLARHVKSAKLACVHGIDHLVVIQPALRRKRNTPAFF